MSDVLLNLVRVADLEDSEGLDVESGATVYSQSDEIELVNPDGESAVMITGHGFTNRDIEYDFDNGDLGICARRSRHAIQMAVDYIGDVVHAKLVKWQRARALVRFNPGYGRFTDIAYRPLTGAGTTYPDGSTTLKDLTGRYSLATSGDGANNYVWCPWRKVMLGDFAGTNPRRVIWTPAGAGQACERDRHNRFEPAYPKGATEGNGATDSGWEKGGTHSADLTFSLQSGGFGHDDIPNSLRVYDTYAASRTRYIEASSLWDSGDANYQGYSFSGSSRVTISIWLRGRFAAGTLLRFDAPGGDYDQISLGSLDLTGWTKLSMNATSADWSTGVPSIKIILSTSTTADSSDFEVGPTVVDQVTGASAMAPEYGAGDTAVTDSYVSAASYTFPPCGSMITSFWWPEGADVGTHYLVGAAATAGRLGMSASDTAAFYRTAAASLSGTVSPREGEINTLAAVWGSAGDMRLYFNGALVDTAADAEREIDVADAATTLYFGWSNNYGAWPLIYLTGRIDRRAWTAAQVAQIDASLRDPVAVQASAEARGRAYRIEQVPSTPRNQQGGTQWTGNLVLKEYEFDANLADITSAEAY